MYIQCNSLLYLIHNKITICIVFYLQSLSVFLCPFVFLSVSALSLSQFWNMSKATTLSPHGETPERLIRPISAPPETYNSPMTEFTSLIDKKILYEAWPRKSARVVEELIVTEKSYVDALSDIITVCSKSFCY